MKRNVVLFCIGTLPLWLGVILNAVLTLLPIPVYFFSVVYLLFWFWLCRRCSVIYEYPGKQAFLLSLFGLVLLALVLVQELIVGHYWVSYFGLATQLYFMPGLAVSGSLLMPLLGSSRLWPLYLAEMGGLYLIAYLGCLSKRKKVKTTR